MRLPSLRVCVEACAARGMGPPHLQALGVLEDVRDAHAVLVVVVACVRRSLVVEGRPAAHTAVRRRGFTRLTGIERRKSDSASRSVSGNRPRFQ